MSDILHTLGAAVVSVGLFIGSLFGYQPEPQIEYLETEALGADTVLPISGQTYALAGAGISSSATSFVLTSFTIPQNGKKIQDSEMSNTFYITFEPGSRARQEIASCTTVVQNADGTASFSGCVRGLSPVTPYTASTSLQFAHNGGSSVIFSNASPFYNDFAAKANDETITGQWTFTTFPITASTSIASATTSGIAELATGDEAASSTLSGDIATSKLALHTAISTSSAPASGNVVVVTGDDGNIDFGFLPEKVSSSTIRVYTSTSTWSRPATTTGLKHIVVEIVGGGGSGGGKTSASGQYAGGGGGGGYCLLHISWADLSATSTIQVGVGIGGPAGSGAANGNNGGTSSFGAFGSSTGGVGGLNSGGGSAGGTGVNCDFNTTGNSGSAGHYQSADDGWGGEGGSSIYGGGGVGALNTTGGTATGYGGGGAGAADTTSAAPAGGAGSGGVVIITEYY